MNKEQAIEEAKKRGLKWVAMDLLGNWFGYKTKPQTFNAHNYWDTTDGGVFLGDHDSDWRDSLSEVL